MTRWPNENKFDDVILAESRRQGVPVALIKAIISLESEFLPGAFRNEAPRGSLPATLDFPQGGDRSIGLMQLLVRTARTLGYRGEVGDRSALTGLYAPAENIRLGTILLRDNVREAARRGLDVSAAISAYNGGWRPALGFGARLPSGKYGNQPYVDRVLERMRYFESTPGPVPLVPVQRIPETPGPAATPGKILPIAPLSGEPVRGGGELPALSFIAAALAAIWLATRRAFGRD